MAELDSRQDYPIGEKRPDLIMTPSGASLEELDIDALERGVLAGEDMRATSRTLMLQAEIAESSGRRQLAQNLRRASELTRVPDEVVLEIYKSLRPGRSTAENLADWAETLEAEFDAPLTAQFLRDASSAYEGRDL